VVAAILVAGLWPFHAPQNEVAWLANGNGVRFGQYGTILSSRALERPRHGRETAFSLEIWLTPAFTYTNDTLLAIYAPDRSAGFSMHQWKTALLLEAKPWTRQDHTGNSYGYVEGVFSAGQSAFVTVTVEAGKTAVYVNGALAQWSKELNLPIADFTGEMVLANSPVGNDSWSGELKGLALYDHQLTAAQVRRHYETWTQSGQPDLAEVGHPFAAYLFDERSGQNIRNHAGPGPDLYIPKRYMELHHTALQWPWNEYRLEWSYWEDVLINVGGFVPLGFFLYTYLWLERRTRQAALATVIVGALVSLTIEVLQALLPTRDSGMTDIITNTLGTAMGVGLCHYTSVVSEKLSESPLSVVRSLASLFAYRHPCTTED
jgi:hypothetical protein